MFVISRHMPREEGGGGSAHFSQFLDLDPFPHPIISVFSHAKKVYASLSKTRQAYHHTGKSFRPTASFEYATHQPSPTHAQKKLPLNTFEKRKDMPNIKSDATHQIEKKKCYILPELSSVRVEIMFSVIKMLNQVIKSVIGLDAVFIWAGCANAGFVPASCRLCLVSCRTNKYPTLLNRSHIRVHSGMILAEKRLTLLGIETNHTPKFKPDSRPNTLCMLLDHSEPSLSRPRCVPAK